MSLRKDVVTTPYDFADYIETEDDVRTVLGSAFEDNDPSEITRKIGAIARSKGMARVAAATGLQREGLYKSLSETGNPELKTLLKILDALGLVLTIRPKRAPRPATALAKNKRTKTLATPQGLRAIGMDVSDMSRTKVPSSERETAPRSKRALPNTVSKVAATKPSEMAVTK